MALGALGGVLGTVFGFAAMIAGMEEAWLSAFFPLGLVAMAVGVAGLVGAALARCYRQPSWILMGIAGVVLVSVISAYVLYSGHSMAWVWNVSGILLIAGSALEFAGPKSRVPGGLGFH